MNNHLFDDILYSWSREMGRGWVTFHPHKDLMQSVNNPVRFLQYPYYSGSIEELEQGWKLNPNSILTIG